MLLFLDFDGVLHPEYHEICVPDDVALVKSKSCCKFTLSNPSQLTN